MKSVIPDLASDGRERRVSGIQVSAVEAVSYRSQTVPRTLEMHRSCNQGARSRPQCLRDSSLVAASSPASVSGYMRSSNISRIIWIECV